MQFAFDENMLSYERKLVTLPDIIAQTGGLMGIIISAASLFTAWIEEQMFTQSILKRVFLTPQHLSSKKKKKKISQIHQTAMNGSMSRNQGLRINDGTSAPGDIIVEDFERQN